MEPNTTYALPNFTGQLFMRGQTRQNALLQMIGGITGYQTTRSTEFPVGQDYSLDDHKSQPATVEGSTAPANSAVGRNQSTNVVQIWHESVSVSYTKEAATGQLSGLNSAGANNPIASELDFQTGAKLDFISRRLNWTLINGVYQKPANNAAGRRTRGILAAITTNTQAAANAALSKKMLETAMRQLVDAGAIADGDTVMCMANTAQLARVGELFESEFNKTNQTRDVGGIRIRTVLTAFGTVNFVLEQDMPQDTLVFANIGVMSLVGLEVPNKGVLFREPLAKVGASESFQIYGELGLNHGLEWMHAKITGLAVA